MPTNCGLLIVLKTKWFRPAGLTVKLLLDPVVPQLSVAVIISVPAFVMVTGPAQTPFTKGSVIVGLIVPEVSLKSGVPL